MDEQDINDLSAAGSSVMSTRVPKPLLRSFSEAYGGSREMGKRVRYLMSRDLKERARKRSKPLSVEVGE